VGADCEDRWDHGGLMVLPQMLIRDVSFTLGLVSPCPWFGLGFVRDQADGALSSAAVPRAGLGPATPPLCRCAKCTIGLILRSGVRTSATTKPVRSSGAWCGRRSGIKEEAAAISRPGGQPRSRPHQVPGRAQYKSSRVGPPCRQAQQFCKQAHTQGCREYRTVS
jgi:hypothetical protein